MNIHLEVNLTEAELNQQFKKLKRTFFMTEWGQSPEQATERFGTAKQLIQAEHLYLQKALESEAINAAGQPPHLTLQELYAVYVCIVKEHDDHDSMESFFNQEKTSLIYRALGALKPELRLFQIAAIVQAFEAITLDEVILMLEYVPEAEGREGHQAYTGFMEIIRNAKHGSHERSSVKFLIQVAESMYRALAEPRVLELVG
jgi:hypothetical protein